MKDARSEKRKSRLEEEIKRILGEAVSGLRKSAPPDERLSLLTITNVELNADKSIAKVYFDCYMAGTTPSAALDIIEENKGWLRKAVSLGLPRIKTPALEFRHDSLFDQSMQMEEVFRKIKSERG